MRKLPPVDQMEPTLLAYHLSMYHGVWTGDVRYRRRYLDPVHGLLAAHDEPGNSLPPLWQPHVHADGPQDGATDSEGTETELEDLWAVFAEGR